MELDEFKAMGSYDNYFGTTICESEQPESKKAIEHHGGQPVRFEKSSSAVYNRKENVDLLNDDDKENEEKDKTKAIFFHLLINFIYMLKDNQIFMNKPIKALCKPGGLNPKSVKSDNDAHEPENKKTDSDQNIVIFT